MKRLLFAVGTLRLAGPLRAKWGKTQWMEAKKSARAHFRRSLRATPSIGGSLFAFNYAFTPSYIAWYKALGERRVSPEELQSVIWLFNERLLSLIPPFLIPAFRRIYLGSFRRGAAKHQKKGKKGKLSPYDYRIAYRPVDDGCFEIDFLSCGMRKLCAEQDAMGLFPAVCRVDYLLSNRLGCGFTRTKTLGDGDELCNCRYFMSGSCEWAPEKGFDFRK